MPEMPSFLDDKTDVLIEFRQNQRSHRGGQRTRDDAGKHQNRKIEQQTDGRVNEDHGDDLTDAVKDRAGAGETENGKPFEEVK